MSMSNTSETKRWVEVLIEADRAYRHYKQLQEEEDIAYVMSILAAM